MTNDLRSWGNFAAMMCVHPLTCEKPRFARAIIAWWPGLGQAMDGDNLVGKIIRRLHWIHPVFVGPRVIQCTTCQKLVFKSMVGMNLTYAIRNVFDPRAEWKEAILLVGEDVDAWGDSNYEELGLEQSKH